MERNDQRIGCESESCRYNDRAGIARSGASASVPHGAARPNAGTRAYAVPARTGTEQKRAVAQDSPFSPFADYLLKIRSTSSVSSCTVSVLPSNVKS